MELTRTFKTLARNDAPIAGGKGASLGEMTQAGIPVPPGFVILASTFDRFLAETDLTQEIEAILATVRHDEMHTVEHASEKIQGLILAAIMPADIASAIMAEHEKLGAEFVAVRSSATAEDGAEHAWAGQLDTHLNTPRGEVLRNVQRCWASLFTPRAIFYRFEKGLHGTAISVAVVIQKMVQSEISGIAFSVHPVTEDRNQLIIEAGFGLGEAIVSGQVTPDSYVVEKEPRRIIDMNISEQGRALYRKEGGGNEWRELGEKGKLRVLSEAQILELSELIVLIEKHYRFPCDIEWAFEGGKFFITQSRPITTLTPSSAEKNLSGTNPLTRLIDSQDWEIRVRRPGYLQPKFIVSAAIAQSVQLSPSVWVNERSNMWIGEINLYNNRTTAELEHALFAAAFTEDQQWPLRVVAELDAAIDAAITFIKDNVSRDWAQASAAEKSDHMQEYVRILSEVQKRYAFAVPLTNWCERQLKNIDASLLEYAVQYKPLDVDRMNESLAAIQRAPIAERDRLRERHTEEFAWIKSNYNIVEPYTSEEVNREIESEIHVFAPKLAPHSPHTYLVTALQIGIYLRNRMKEVSQQIWFSHEPYLHQVAKDLNMRRDDILQLTPDELCRSLLAGKLVVDESEIRERGFGFATGVVEQEPFVLTGSIVTILRERFSMASVATREIKGDVASKGIITGRVRILHTIQESNKLQDGDVLVTNMTTPDFIVIMKRAGAIVTDEGGLSCHAAIVSRELKKPCIIGTKIATQVLKDGDMVEVDAERGVVRKIS